MYHTKRAQTLFVSRAGLGNLDPLPSSQSRVTQGPRIPKDFLAVWFLGIWNSSVRPQVRGLKPSSAHKSRIQQSKISFSLQSRDLLLSTESRDLKFTICHPKQVPGLRILCFASQKGKASETSLCRSRAGTNLIPILPLQGGAYRDSNPSFTP